MTYNHFWTFHCYELVTNQGYDVVVVEGQGGIFALVVGQIVSPLHYSRCDT